LGARCFTKEYGNSLDVLILSGSPKKNDAVGAAKFLAKTLKNFGRGKKKSKFLEALVFGPYAAAFRKEKSRFAWICKAPAVVGNYEDDPMCGFTFTADGFEVLFELLYRTYENKKHPYKYVRQSLPIMFISGEEDPCIGGEKNFNAAMASMRSAGYEKTYGKMYKTLRHEIFNEEEKYEVFQDVLNFIEDNI
jgi:alpha-beta hydrolase superfamily lysophospholipase